MLGTLSAVVGHPINGCLPMPGWCTVQLDGSVREPPKEEPRALAPAAGNVGKGKRGSSGSDFYSGSSPEFSSEDDSESDTYDSASGAESESSSEYTSGSGTGSESGSDSESSSEEESGSSGDSRSSRSNSSESSSDDSSESNSTKGEEGVGLLIMGPGTANTAATYGASAPAPHSQDLTGLVERLSVVDREDSASPQLGQPAGGLGSLSMAGMRGPGHAQGGLGKTQSSARSSSVSSDVGADPEGEANVTFPTTLLRHQAGGGLQVDYRFTRGRASALSRPSTNLTLRLTLTNHRETPIRRIRVVPPRDGTPMEPFPEVQVLAAGGVFCTNLGIDFGGRSKDVSFVASRRCWYPMHSQGSKTHKLLHSCVGNGSTVCGHPMRRMLL